jgi:NTE family protein
LPVPAPTETIGPVKLSLADQLPRPTAFVLGGGGSWGALQLGMLEALARTDLTPDLIVGTSVGSLNGAILAHDPARAVERLDRIWSTMTRADVFPGGWLRSLRTLTSTRTWIYDSAPLADLMTAQLPVTTFAELRVPFVAIATDFTTGAIAELESGELRSALLASTAIPGIYPAVQRDGHVLVDGGVVANVPIATAVRRGARSLVVLDCGLPAVDSKRAGTMLDVLVQALSIGARHNMASDLAMAADLPVVWLSRGAPNHTTVLDFSATGQMRGEAGMHSLEVLRQLVRTGIPGPGLYGADPELLHPLDIALGRTSASPVEPDAAHRPR